MGKYSTLIIIINILMIVDYILFNIGMFFLLAKEKKKKYLAFIPIVNYYQYFKLCRIPFITFFIPLVNIFIIFLSPIRLAKTYRCNKKETLASILLQKIFIIFIGLSDRKNKYNEDPDFTIKSQEDIDNLEAKLVSESDEVKEKDYTIFKVREEETNKQMARTDSIEKQINDIEDEILDDSDEPFVDVFNNLMEAEKEENNVVETLDMYDIIDNKNQNSLESIDAIEESQILNNSVDENVDRNEYTEFKELEKSVDEIAFESIKDNNESLKTINVKTDLKCPRCGTSLEGSNGTCPGCSADVSDIVGEKIKEA